MTIGLVLYPLADKKASGLGRMAYALAQELIRRHPEHRFIVFTKGPVEEGLQLGTGVDIRQGGGFLWLDRLLWRSPRADVYYFSTPMLPLLWTPKRSVAVVHDFAYLTAYANLSAARRFRIRMLQRRSLRRASAVAAISEFTKAEAIRLMHIDPKKVRIIYNGITDVLAVAPDPVPVPEPFLLYAGGMKARKNVKNIVRAFALACPKLPGTVLVLTGGVGGAFGRSVQAVTSELGITERVHFLGNVLPSRLSYLYAHAYGFVFPSRLEGFGMAALEAMSCGVPTIASTAPGLAEAAGDGALVVDPESPQAIADAMVRLCTDQALRQSLIGLGRARAARFSWARAADETLALLKEAAAN